MRKFVANITANGGLALMGVTFLESSRSPLNLHLGRWVPILRSNVELVVGGSGVGGEEVRKTK